MNASQDQIAVRRDIWVLDQNGPFSPITLAYANAVAAMQARSADDPTSWSYQAAIHATFAAVPPRTPWNACQHQSWFFLPWHRMYLFFFERIVRKAVMDANGPADFALPYWNYDRGFPTNTLPEAFRTPKLPRTNDDNPLFLASPLRNSPVMRGGQLPSTITSPAKALADTAFSSPSGTSSFGGGRVGPAHFGGALGDLETTPHNVIHGAIGGALVPPCQSGVMSDPRCAALDPIFWLHHANIDRVWNVWLAMPGRANPSDQSWLNQSFEFRDERGAVVRLSGAQVVDSATQLHYVYDDETSAVQGDLMGTPPNQLPSGPPELVAASDEPVVLTGTGASVSLKATPTTGALLDAIPSGARRTFLNVEDITAAANPGVGYAVYLDAPDGGRHVGNVSLFGIEEMINPDRPHAGAPGFRHTFDVTSEVADLTARGLWNPDDLRVRLEPIVVAPPPGEEWPAADAPEAHTPITIGRVSLFVE